MQLNVTPGQVPGVLVVADGDVDKIGAAARLPVVARRVHRESVGAIPRGNVVELSSARSGPGAAIGLIGDGAVAASGDRAMESEVPQRARRRPGVHPLAAVLHPFELAPRRSCLEPEGREIPPVPRSEEHTSELQSLAYLVCRLLLEKKK